MCKIGLARNLTLQFSKNVSICPNFQAHYLVPRFFKFTELQSNKSTHFTLNPLTNYKVYYNSLILNYHEPNI